MARMQDIKLTFEIEPIVKVMCMDTECKFNMMRLAHVSSDYNQTACAIKHITVGQYGKCMMREEAEHDSDNIPAKYDEPDGVIFGTNTDKDSISVRSLTRLSPTRLLEFIFSSFCPVENLVLAELPYTNAIDNLIFQYFDDGGVVEVSDRIISLSMGVQKVEMTVPFWVKLAREKVSSRSSVEDIVLALIRVVDCYYDKR